MDRFAQNGQCKKNFLNLIAIIDFKTINTIAQLKPTTIESMNRKNYYYKNYYPKIFSRLVLKSMIPLIKKSKELESKTRFKSKISVYFIL